MSKQKDVLLRIAEAIRSGGAYRIAEWFTEDFRLYEPTKPNWPTGHEGISKLLEQFRTLTPPIRFEPLDMVEEGNRVAVRWVLSSTDKDEPVHFAMMHARPEERRGGHARRLSAQVLFPCQSPEKSFVRQSAA